ncbi:Rv1733c family protein [Mycobacterium sp. URHB0021]
MQSFTVDPARWRIARIFARNPLIRVSDRIEALVMALMVGVLLVSVPIAGAVGTAVYDSSSQRLAEQAPTSHTVAATAIKSSIDTAGLKTVPVSVMARWQVNGREHTGLLKWDRPEVSVGDQMDIWVNADGQKVAPPSWPAFHAVAVGLGIWLSFAVGAVAVFMVVWLRLNHARLAGWDRELDRLASDDGSGRANR